MIRIRFWLAVVAIGLILSWFVWSVLVTGFTPIFIPHTTYISTKLFPLWASQYTFYPANTSSNTSCIEYAVWHKTISTFNYTTQTSHSYTENITINSSAQLDSIYASLTHGPFPEPQIIWIYTAQNGSIKIPQNHVLLCPNKVNWWFP